jgi:hypothetical protein
MLVQAHYYSYCCPVFGSIIVYQLPCGSFVHYVITFRFHFISQLPFRGLFFLSGEILNAGKLNLNNDLTW